jgi:alpha-glucosidase
MLGLPGSSYLYQGEELGLPEVTNIPAGRREDPAFFRTNGEDGYRDGCRVPIPWTTDLSTNYGFSQSAGNRAWLPQPDSWGQLSVAAQEVAADSSLNFYRSALKLRKSLPQLGDGALVWADQDSTQYLAFTRSEIFIAVNPSGNDLTIALPGAAELLIASDAGVSVGGNELKLPADTAVWLRLVA